jgi:hypothetical protein
MARTKLSRRYKRNPSGDSPRHNPPLFKDLVEFVGPGFASFALTRFGTRVAATQVAKWKPNLGKHAGAGISVGAFLAAWFLGHKWKWLEKYHTPITVGAAIAALQSVIQLYFPKLGWMVADATPELESAAPMQQLTAPDAGLQPVDLDPNEFTYDDSYDAGRYSKTGHRPQGQPHQAAAARGADATDDTGDLDINEALSPADGNLGVFSSSN